MNTWVWIAIAVVAAIIIVGVLWSALRTRRTRSLQDRFGPEYDRELEKAGGRREAERELAEREKRHDELELRPLSDDARERYIEEWQATQARFVDDPTGAVSEADNLVQRVMRDRGYPVDDFEQRAADISVEHPELVERYRTANGSPARASAARRQPRTSGTRYATTGRCSSSCSRSAMTTRVGTSTTRAKAPASRVCARSARSSAPCSATDRSRGRHGAHVRRPTSARAESSCSPGLSSPAACCRRCAGSSGPSGVLRSTEGWGRSRPPRSGGCRATDACGAGSVLGAGVRRDLLPGRDLRLHLRGGIRELPGERIPHGALPAPDFMAIPVDLPLDLALIELGRAASVSVVVAGSGVLSARSVEAAPSETTRAQAHADASVNFWYI